MTVKGKLNMKKDAIVRVRQDTKNKILKFQELYKKRTGFFIHHTEIMDNAIDLLTKHDALHENQGAILGDQDSN